MPDVPPVEFEHALEPDMMPLHAGLIVKYGEQFAAHDVLHIPVWPNEQSDVHAAGQSIGQFR
jgi:hypothetical protein